jgi:Protein of unknown function (DUF5818)
MKRIVGMLGSMFLATALVCLAFGQSQSQQPHPVDPTAQAPATPPQGSTPPTFPTQSGEDKSATSTSKDSAKTFMGTVVLSQGDYVLRSGDKQYKLDDQSKAKQYVGKDVKVLGTLDRQENQIHVESIDIAPNL